jgi:hypothetical protein
MCGKNNQENYFRLFSALLQGFVLQAAGGKWGLSRAAYDFGWVLGRIPDMLILLPYLASTLSIISITNYNARLLNLTADAY